MSVIYEFLKLAIKTAQNTRLCHLTDMWHMILCVYSSENSTYHIIVFDCILGRTEFYVCTLKETTASITMCAEICLMTSIFPKFSML